MFDLSRIPEAVQSEGGVSRRLFMACGSALAALPTLALRTRAADARPKFDANPFSLGVASGDPDATSVMLCNKLARKPQTDQPNSDGLKPLNEETLRKTNTILGRRQRLVASEFVVEAGSPAIKKA